LFDLEGIRDLHASGGGQRTRREERREGDAKSREPHLIRGKLVRILEKPETDFSKRGRWRTTE